jgi:hypothetical protein
MTEAREAQVDTMSDGLAGGNVTPFPARGGSGVKHQAGKHFKILTRNDIMEDKEPEWLVEGLYPQDCFVELFGVPDAYKSFFALGVAFSVATGRRLLDGYNVSPGDVVYIYGEGGRGIGKRLHAWEVSHKCEALRFFGIAEPVDMTGLPEPGVLIADIKAAEISPKLIVLDTLARCFGSGDENSTKDMNAFVQGCDKLRRAFPGCTVLVVHHCGWEERRGRGARALQGALDTETKMERGTGTFVTFSVTKQKDFAKPESAITLELVDVPKTGSAILRRADAAKVKAAEQMTDTTVLALLRSAGEKGLSVPEMEQRTGLNPHTLKTSRQRLKRAKRIENRERRWFALPAPEVSPGIEAELAVRGCG